MDGTRLEAVRQAPSGLAAVAVVPRTGSQAERRNQPVAARTATGLVAAAASGPGRRTDSPTLVAGNRPGRLVAAVLRTDLVLVRRTDSPTLVVGNRPGRLGAAVLHTDLVLVRRTDLVLVRRMALRPVADNLGHRPAVGIPVAPPSDGLFT